MLETLYNLTILAETYTLMTFGGKLALDYAWSKAVKYACYNDLWNKPGVKDVMDVFMKTKI